MKLFRTFNWRFPLILGACLAVMPNAIASNQHWAPGSDDVLNFEVLRQGKPFGRHVVSFANAEDELVVTSDIELKVSVGPFRAFYYRHESEEVWRDGKLFSLEGTTRKDGEDFEVFASSDENELVVDGTLFEGSVANTIIPSSHWNIEQIRSSQILSTESGELLDVSIEELGTEEILVEGKPISADRYRLQSDLTVDLWYDESGRWVKCMFEARGQKIEYVLKS